MNDSSFRYEVNGKKYVLNTDMTLRERTEVSRILNSAKAEGNQVTAEMTSDDAKKLLSILMIPEGHDVKVDPDEVRESVEFDVIKDFFLSRVGKGREIRNSLLNSIGN